MIWTADLAAGGHSFDTVTNLATAHRTYSEAYCPKEKNTFGYWSN